MEEKGGNVWSFHHTTGQPDTSGDEPESIRVLVVEDEKKLALSIKQRLDQAGYIVDCALDGNEAAKCLEGDEYSILLLDLTLPGKSGIDILRDLKSSRKRLPVIIISANDKTRDRVSCLNLGADDFIVKPFDSNELLARMAAVLRRVGHTELAILRAGTLVMDLIERRVSREGKAIDLSPREFTLLEFFLRNPNQIITRQRLLQEVWGYEFETETNIVDVYLSYLRKAVDGPFQKKMLHTVHGEGFILVP